LGVEIRVAHVSFAAVVDHVEIDADLSAGLDAALLDHPVDLGLEVDIASMVVGAAAIQGFAGIALTLVVGGGPALRGARERRCGQDECGKCENGEVQLLHECLLNPEFTGNRSGWLRECRGGPRGGHMSLFDDVAPRTDWWETAGTAANFVRLRTLAARGTGELSAPSDQGIALRRSSLRSPGSRT